ncbi:MAG TPA: OmpA family protein [Chitinophagales bacterium]|nr:OmpA family protein [Chitinophagales bacterium]
MGKFTKLLLVFVFLNAAMATHAQNNSSSKKKEPAKTSGTKTSNDKDSKKTDKSTSKDKSAKDKKATTKDDKSNAKDKTVNGNTEKTANIDAKNDTVKGKDSQNQLQFLKPDMESKNFNFYRRKEISTPLQPRYDLDSAAFQKGKKKTKQQQSYLARQYAFPAKPKDQWEIGVNFGVALLSGDVKPFVSLKGITQNIGAGFTIRKALGYTISLRGGYNFMMMTGRNWEPDGNLAFNRALHGEYDARVNYWNNPNLVPANTEKNLNMNKLFFYNYRTYVHEAHFAAVLNLGNVRFHKERNICNFYLVAGVDGFLFRTKMDALDANGAVYDFSSVHDLYVNPANQNPNGPVVNERLDRRKQSLKLLNGILDGKYESDAEHENNATGFKQWQFIPAGTVGIGVQFHVAKFMSIGLEERMIFTGSDLLDGYRWQQDEHSGFTRSNDNISYTAITLNFHVGKNRTEPMYWLNPMYHTYRKLGEVDPKGVADDILKDDDGDGVINALDKEPNTKKDCPVDTHGVALDSDKDGIIDCLDKEPFSPPGFPIDSNGAAIIPPNPCCDTTGFGNEGLDGTDGTDGTNGGIGGAGATGGKRRGAGGGNYDCSKIELPSVIFDADKYYIDPQYYGNLHQIAERMQMCPDMKVVVTGYDESKNDQKFNEQLAWNRANAAVDYMVEKYGISRDRFIVKYQGGKKAAEGTPYEKKMKNKVEFRYANDGEGGDSNPPAPHPGLKAGSNK